MVTGDIDTTEDPPRHLYCESNYKISVVDANQMNEYSLDQHFLTIGKLRLKGDVYVKDMNYIPPCRTMVSHHELAHYFIRFDEMFNSIRRSSRTIILKANGRPGGNEYAANISTISNEALRYLMSIYFNLKNKGNLISPLLMTEYISTLASISYSSLLCLSGVQKDELFKYFLEWSDITPGAFEDMLSSTFEIKYEHQDIRSVMVRLESFLVTFCELWEKLSHLEYIGQHKESFVVSVSGGNNNNVERKGFMISD